MYKQVKKTHLIKKSQKKKKGKKTERSEVSTTGGDKNHFNAIINIGSDDGMRAVKLLDYFKKYADLYPKKYWRY